MNVLFLSPGFPAEMPFFTRGLSEIGVRVLGLGDQPDSAIPLMAREHLSAYLRVSSFADEAAILGQVADYARHTRIDRVECLWEPLMILAARLRETLSLPGMTVEQTIPFRDKERMKQVLDAASLRTPHHAAAATAQEVRAAGERIGYPLIVKPIAGAGSADTHRVDGPADLERVLQEVRHVPVVSVEEFIEAEEFTFDTICAGGRILFYNICWYRPRPLISRTIEWISPQTVALRRADAEHLEPGRKLGAAVLRAMDFQDGFTHMEWHLKADGEAVFGEIGARPPGARTVDVMNFSCDADLFRGWAEAVCLGKLAQPVERKYNAASIFKRAHGQGRIQRIEGLESLMARYGEHIVAVDLLPVGAERRDTRAALISDGMVIVRHPELETCVEIADHVGSDLNLYAG